MINLAEAPSSDLISLVGMLGHSWLVWFMAVVLVWLVITRVSESYEGAAKVLGPLGRHLAERHRKRSEKYRRQVNDEAKQLALELVPKVIPADYEAVKVQLDNITARVTDLEVENSALRSFVIYDEGWHFTLLLTAARSGDSLDLPPRYTWLEFREKWRLGWRPHAVDGIPAVD